MAKNKQKPKTKKKLSVAAKFLIAGLIIIAIPFLIWGGILLNDYLHSHDPVVADRFEGDLVNEITDEQINQVKTDVTNLGDFDDVEVDLKTATLRVYVDADDAISQDEAIALVDSIYNQVTSDLDVATYFTSTDNVRMYDLEVHVYNSLDKVDDDDYIYVQKIKNAQMTTPEVQVVSEPKDQDLVDSIYADQYPETTVDTTSESDGTVTPDADATTNEEAE